MIRMVLVPLFLGMWLPAQADISLRFDSVPVSQLAKAVFGEVLQKPYVIEDDVSKRTVSMQLQNVPLGVVAMTVARVLEGSHIEVKEEAGVFFIGQRKEDELVIYQPRHRSAAALRSLIAQAFSQADISQAKTVRPASAKAETTTTQSSTSNGASFQTAPTVQSGSVSAEDLQYVVLRLPPAHARAVRELLSLIDTPADQLYIRAVAYDVTTDSASGTSVDLALSLLGSKFGLSLSGGSLSNAQAVTFKSATVEAVARVLDSDNRFKAVSRPALRVRSGGHARFSVGQEVPTLGGVTTNVGGATQAIVYRSAGVIFDVEPVVRDGGVDLTVKQTISDFRTTQTSQINSPTLNKRELSTDLNVKPGEVIVLAGLDSEEDNQGGRSFFGIPLGNTKANTQRQTLLLLEVQAL